MEHEILPCDFCLDKDQEELEREFEERPGRRTAACYACSVLVEEAEKRVLGSRRSCVELAKRVSKWRQETARNHILVLDSVIKCDHQLNKKRIREKQKSLFKMNKMASLLAGLNDKYLDDLRELQTHQITQLCCLHRFERILNPGH